jgi:hypothetical protein
LIPQNTEAAAHLSKLSQMEPPLDIQFQIYYANQQANQGKEVSLKKEKKTTLQSQKYR